MIHLPVARWALCIAALLSLPVAAQTARASGTEQAADAVRVLVLPNGETTLASPVPGRIIAMNAGLGLPFRQGDVLVSLDCEEPQARLAMAKAELTAATDQHEAKLRMQGLEQASDVEVALAATSMRRGSCSSASASDCTAGGKVAEKSRFCRRAGNIARIRASSSAKPRSSRRSASSSTSVATAPSLSALCSTRSSRRPGVATTMSAPPRRAIIWGLIDTPPLAVTIFNRRRAKRA